MSGGVDPCPAPKELERLVSSGEGDESVRRHIRGCEACRERFENARFEHDFAAAVNAGVQKIEESLPQLPGYEIVREVSRGGQGIVYEAVQRRTNRRVAIKVLRQDHAIAKSQRARFEREIEIAAALQHPGIVGVYDSIGMAGGRHALVLEYVEGQSLDRENLDPGEDGARVRASVGLIAKVCDAIHYAHQRGVMHRDLKPSNILVDSAGQPRVLDFGVACWFGGSGAESARITLTGEFAGTLAYAAPEQVSGVAGAPDLRSDLYALGVMLYQLCFGSLPYEVNGPLDSVIRNILENSPSRTRVGRGARVDEDLWVIISKALSKEPDRRYQSAAAMGADLRRYLNGETIEARRDSRLYVLRKTLSRHRYATGAVVAAFAGLTAFGVTVAMSNARLSEALRTSTFERARALGAAGNRPEADLLLWPEVFRLGSALEDPLNAMFRGSPEERKVLWAFAELQGATPCLATVTCRGGLQLAIACASDRVFTLSRDGFLTERELPGLRNIADRKLFDEPVIAAAISPNSKRCVLMYEQELLCIDITSGELLGRSAFRSLQVGAKPRISEDGSTLVAADAEGTTSVFALPSLRKIFEQRRNEARQAFWVSPAGDRIGIVSEDWKAEVYGLPTGEKLYSRSLFPPEQVARLNSRKLTYNGLEISERNAVIVLAFERYLHIAGMQNSAEPVSINATFGSRVFPEFTRSGEWMMSRSYDDSTVKLWKCSDWSVQATYPGHSGSTMSCSMTPDERLLCTLDKVGVLRVWSGPRGEVQHALPDSGIMPHDIAFDARAERLWAAGSDGRVASWSKIGQSPPVFVRADERTAFCVAFSPALGVLAAGGESGNIELFTQESEPIARLDAGAESGVSCVRFSPDSGSLAASARAGSVTIYDTASWKPREKFDAEVGRVVMVRWSPDGKSLAIAGAIEARVPNAAGICEVRRGPDFASPTRWKAHDIACRSVEYSPDGKTLATAGDDGMVRFWDADSLVLRSEFRVGDHQVFCLSYHEGGRVLAAGDRAGRVTLIGLPELQRLAHFDGTEPIMAMEFVGERLAVAALEGPIAIWDFGLLAGCVSGNQAYWRSQIELGAEAK